LSSHFLLTARSGAQHVASARLTWGLTGAGLGSDLIWCSLGTTPELDSDNGPLMLSPQCCSSKGPIQREVISVPGPPPPDQLLTCGLGAAYSTCPSLSFPTRQRGHRRACLGIINSEGETRPGYPGNCKLFICYPLPSAKILVLGFLDAEKGQKSAAPQL